LSLTNKNRIFAFEPQNDLRVKLQTRNIFTGIAHVLVWIAVLFIPQIFFHRPGQQSFGISDVFLWALMVIFFYLNYYILVPKLLTRNKFFWYSASIAVMLMIAFFSLRWMMLTIDAPGEMENLLRRHAPEKAREILYVIARNRGMGALFFSFLVLALSTSIKVTGDWYKTDKKRKEAENEQLSTELNLLKSQINPHFFFNTLNNIYSLAIQKSGKTPEAIVKLSELMRYIIYDTDKDKVPLSKEIDYISNYIELEKLRLRDNADIRFTVDGNPADKLIEPLLILPFIENAFKHGTGLPQTSPISIHILIRDSRLNVVVENPVLPATGTLEERKQGIGRTNTERRLQLLYNKNYKLETTVTNTLFRVDLTLNLDRDEMPGGG
jgi:two-component system, LytTR family, sensor kinase